MQIRLLPNLSLPKPAAVMALLLLLCPTAGKAAPASDYLCEDKRSLTDLETQRWYPEEFPLKVHIPAVPYQVKQPKMYLPLVKEAFAAWAKPFKAIRFVYVDQPEQADILIEWKEYFDVGAWGMAHLPYLYTDATGKVRHHSTVYLAVNAQPGSVFNPETKVLFSYHELLAIAKHEVGHAIGLGHSKGDMDLMGPQGYGFLSKSVFQASKRDIQTLLRLYRLPRKLKQHPCEQGA
ncbi:MAG: hypothetical protein CVV27_03080 [Candidatus Melainabacteria bacterium HGW-Melainabacteria-1]|nr:MAG: hypothetical protein CVV27_03080 [Candidatus Melainabacteria bacterium HGW-Melainabacteria-1]